MTWARSFWPRREGPRYGELLQQHGDSGAGLNDAEKALFGFTHADVGARLLDRWGMPEEVFLPVLWHHEAAWSGPHERVSAIVPGLANQIANAPEDATPDHNSQEPGTINALRLLGLGPEDLQETQGHDARAT